MNTCGVLALQGDFEAHCRAVGHAGATPLEVRTAADLNRCHALIIPGGESTTMLKLLDEENLTEPLRMFCESHPIYGSCAGAILMAKDVTGPAQPSLGFLDIGIERNAYGRQLDSRIVQIDCHEGDVADAGEQHMEAVFIRAPIIRRVGALVRTLGSYQGNPVWVEQGRHMVTTFHPELTGDLRVHRRFLDRISVAKS